MDERGFVKDTPVYQLIENEAEFSVDAAEYAANLDICQSNYSQFLWALEKDRYENIQADAEAIDPMELSGGYAGGGNTYSVSMFSSMDSGNWAGTFMVGGESGDLYLLNGNLYTAEILSQKYVLGFSRQGDKVLMDVYVDGEAVGSAEMTERNES